MLVLLHHAARIRVNDYIKVFIFYALSLPVIKIIYYSKVWKNAEHIILIADTSSGARFTRPLLAVLQLMPCKVVYYTYMYIHMLT